MFRFHLRAPRFHLRAMRFGGLEPSEARRASVGGSLGSSAASGGGQALSFSRRRCARALLVCSLGRREAERRETHPKKESASFRSFCAQAANRPPRGAHLVQARSPFGAPPRFCAGIIHPNSARAALPGTTGCKRENPLRHQCSEHLADRVRPCPDGTMPKPPANKSDELRPQEPHPLRQSASPVDVPYDERDCNG